MRPITMLLGFVLLLSACTSASPLPADTSLPPAPIPSATPTLSPTPLPPEPGTAMGIALDRFDTARSYTVHTQWSNDYHPGSDLFIEAEGETLVNREEDIRLNTQTGSSVFAIIDEVCIRGASYRKDATGLYKPTQFICKSNATHPRIVYLDDVYPELADYQAFTFNYVGEEMLGAVNTFKYEMIITAEQLNDPRLEYEIIDPKIFYYVNATDGNLARMEYSIPKMIWDYNGEETQRQSTTDYSAWNTTTFDVPEVVDPGNIETQVYAGQSASVINFTFPKIYRFEETFGDPKLTTPTGSSMTITIIPITIATLSSKNPSDSVCELLMGEQLDVLASWEPTLLSAKWVYNDSLQFCKAVVETSLYPKVIYMFNEPLEITWARGGILPTAFFIDILVSGEEDPETIFWDVISTLEIIK